MKKKIAMLLGATLAMGLVGCGSSAAGDSANTEVAGATTDTADTVSVVSTIYPSYDWAKEIVGDNKNVELTLLLDDGVDLHSYEPSVEDIAKISTADVFIYVGGESDGWVDDALAEATNKDMVVINMMDVLADQVKEEEVVEGMQVGEHAHDHEHEHEEGEEHEHEHDEAEEAEEHEHEHDEAEEAEEHEHHHEEGEVEYDEHVWLSLKSATTLVRAINDAMCQVDADNADTYKANATAYTEKLAALDAEYAACVKDAKYDTVLFGDRFPFRYLIDDYNLNYYAAFVGCSAETEASFETIAFLSEKVDELDLPAILVIETSDQKIAKTIQSNLTSAKADILVMDSIQSTKLGETSSYLDIMTQNLEVLKKALN